MNVHATGLIVMERRGCATTGLALRTAGNTDASREKPGFAQWS